MATTYAANATNAFNTNPPVKGGPETGGARVRELRDVITFASQASGDTIVVGGKKLPIGATVLYGFINTDTSTATATLAVGISGSTAKYKAAGAVTTTNAPQLFGVVAGAIATTTEEQIIVTVGTAALPSSGTAQIHLFYTVD